MYALLSGCKWVVLKTTENMKHQISMTHFLGIWPQEKVSLAVYFARL